jgi:hypothetical protein
VGSEFGDNRKDVYGLIIVKAQQNFYTFTHPFGRDIQQLEGSPTHRLSNRFQVPSRAATASRSTETRFEIDRLIPTKHTITIIIFIIFFATLLLLKEYFFVAATF